jgi:hypothetical protein
MPTLTGGSFTGVRGSSAKRGGYFRPYWLTIGEPSLTNPKGGTTNTNELYHDRNYNIATSQSFKDIVIPVSAELDRPGPALALTRSSSNEAIAYPDSTDASRWITVGSGTVNLTLSTSAQSVTKQVVTGSTAVVRTFSSFATGTLAKSVYDWMEARLTGLTLSDSTRNLFTTMVPESDAFFFNSSCWANGLDLTCVSMYNDFGWNGSGGRQRAGTLITPRHLLFVGHFLPPIGTTFWFVSMGEVVYRRTLSSLTFVPGTAETWIGELNAVLPSDITPAKVLPSAVALTKFMPPANQVLGTWLATNEWVDYPYGVPSFVVNQNCQVGLAGITGRLLRSVNSYPSSSDYYGALSFSGGLNMFAWSEATILRSAKQREFSYSVGYGDSGSPRFMVISGTPVLLTIETGNGGDSPSLEGTYINSILSLLTGGYALTTYDLTAFPNV